jgi:hypothetical protein
MHQRVKHGHDVVEGGFDSGGFDSGGFDTGELVVYLSDAEAAATAIGAPSITVLELATMVLAYWDGEIMALHTSLEDE